MIEIKQTYQLIPEQFLDLKLKAAAVYVYAKLSMLQGKLYTQTKLINNAITRGSEGISERTFQRIIKELKECKLIDVEKVKTEKADHPINRYELQPISGYFKAVSNDFINLPLEANVKGFCILLSLLKYEEIPTNIKHIERLTGVCRNQVKTYLQALRDAKVIEGNKLSTRYFPNLIEERKGKEVKALKETLRGLESARIQKELDWFEKVMSRLPIAYNKQLTILRNIEMGTFNQTESTKEIESIYKTTIIL